MSIQIVFMWQIIPKRFRSTINSMPLSLSRGFIKYSGDYHCKNLCMVVLSINYFQCIYCFVLLTPSRYSVPKTVVSSDFFVLYVYHEVNVMLHTIRKQNPMKYYWIHIKYVNEILKKSFWRISYWNNFWIEPVRFTKFILATYTVHTYRVRFIYNLLNYYSQHMLYVHIGCVSDTFDLIPTRKIWCTYILGVFYIRLT